MKSLWIALALLALPAAAQAQDSSNADVLAVVDRFFEGLNTSDAALMASTSVDEAMVISVLERDDDRPDMRVRTMPDSVAGLSQGENFREVYWEPVVLVSGPVAVVWAPYSFDVDGSRSHCGIDVFNLLRIDGEWKITGIQYSVEPNCPAGR